MDGILELTLFSYSENVCNIIIEQSTKRRGHTLIKFFMNLAFIPAVPHTILNNKYKYNWL